MYQVTPSRSQTDSPHEPNRHDVLSSLQAVGFLVPRYLTPPRRPLSLRDATRFPLEYPAGRRVDAPATDGPPPSGMWGESTVVGLGVDRSGRAML
jgi:hypothetical protein